jgi:hypothetical protein
MGAGERTVLAKPVWNSVAHMRYNHVLTDIFAMACHEPVVRLPNIGFKFITMELFWLAAIPGLRPVY